MCGIAGAFRFDQQLVDHDLLVRMAQVQRHRGPDDEGFYHDGQVGLAFRRLAILDLSPLGHQPMTSADESCWLVYNGEIYNHDELRQQLTKHGHAFRSRSDSEVILAAYQQWGIECLQHFNGMWGFALWDKKKQRLFCARDRLGVKPFYYHQNAQRLLFASEIKALLVDTETPRIPNEQAVYRYLLFGQVYFGNQTFFQDIQQLPAAHYLVLDQQGLQIERYWQLNHTRYQPQIKDADAIENFRYLFFDSVRLRLQSDVPVGTCLSGGLDSSAIVCVANQILFGNNRPERVIVGDRQKTFSACYENDPGVDERQWIVPVITKTGAESHFIFPTSEGLFTDLEALVWHQDEPVVSSSIYAQWCVMRRARQVGVTVMLDGQGGDEAMGGYQRYYWTYLAGLLRSGKFPEFVTTLRQPWGVNLLPSPADWLGVAYATLDPGLQQWVKLFQKHWETRAWLGPALLHSQLPIHGGASHPTWLGKLLESDLTFDCLPALLRYEDRNSMAHSIEARVPFLDYRIIEFMASLPDRLKIRNGQMKWLLRESLRNELPVEVHQRRNKMGFGTPEYKWLRQHWPNISVYLSSRAQIFTCGWLKSDIHQDYFCNPNAITPANVNMIWRWLNLEVWLRKCVNS